MEGLERAGRHQWGARANLTRGRHELAASFAQRGAAAQLADLEEQAASGQSGAASWRWQRGGTGWTGEFSRGLDRHESFGGGLEPSRAGGAGDPTRGGLRARARRARAGRTAWSGPANRCGASAAGRSVAGVPFAVGRPPHRRCRVARRPARPRAGRGPPRGRGALRRGAQRHVPGPGAGTRRHARARAPAHAGVGRPGAGDGAVPAARLDRHDEGRDRAARSAARPRLAAGGARLRARAGGAPAARGAVAAPRAGAPSTGPTTSRSPRAAANGRGGTAARASRASGSRTAAPSRRAASPAPRRADPDAGFRAWLGGRAMLFGGDLGVALRGEVAGVGARERQVEPLRRLPAFVTFGLVCELTPRRRDHRRAGAQPRGPPPRAVVDRLVDRARPRSRGAAT